MTSKRDERRAIEAHLAANRLMSARAACAAAIESGGGTELTALRETIEERIATARKSGYDAAFRRALDLSQTDDRDGAIRAYREAIALAPQQPAAYANLATQLQLAGDLDAAAAVCRDGLASDPDYAPLHYNLGVILGQKGEPDAAIAAYREAVAAAPGWAEAWFNLAAALQEQEALTEAVDAYARALDAKPDYAEAANNMGNALRDLGRFEEALAAFDKALALDPDHSTARFNRALARLSLGDFERGWADYATRFDDARIRKIAGHRDYGLPRWTGGKIEGKTLLVLGEQGAGDTLQFARYLPMLEDFGARVVLECAAGLVPLLEGFPGLDGIHARPKEPSLRAPADLHVQLLDLPLLFGTTAETIPADIPYVHADPARAARWADRIGAEGTRVGLVWSGNPRNRANRRRAMPLAALAPLAAVDGIRLFSLQKGPAAEELGSAGFDIDDIASDFSDFADTAAAIASLDLVITVCTSVAHLAGAMGAPTWTMLHKVPDWRWLPRAGTSPWYPGMRLFYQETAGDWDGVVARIAEEMKRVQSQ